MFYATVFALIPRPRYMFWLGWHIGWSYAGLYDWLKKKTIAYYRSQLMKLDTGFMISEAGRELIRKRNEARERGIDPMSSEYPGLDDVLKRP
ncbi:MAG: hypothetical protein OQJ98_00875 [Candidatus Pacebacteria bacterium]|nr:hypothetical protein [Candidatus Paceibacterota bacterium]